VLQTRFRFTLVIADAAGSTVHREEVHDFGPCYEDLLFSAVVGGAVPNDGALPPARLEPLWKGEAWGRVAGVTVDLQPLRKTYGLSVLRAHAWAILVERKLLDQETAPDSRFFWRLEAREGDAAGRPRKFRAALSRQPYPILRSRLPELGNGPRPVDERPVSIFIRQEVLAALREETARALDLERADVLTGHLVQEPEGRVGVLVTARTPAVAEKEPTRAHFTFSPLTFVAARQEVAGRADGATVVGWHHSHPPPCGRSCLQSLPPCGTGMLFFSVDDCGVHRASFPAPYMIALVSGKAAGRRADDPGVKAFGWRDGAIVEREFTVF
jgi:hypothetical protein